MRPGEVILPDLSRFLEQVETVNTSENSLPRGVFLVHHESTYSEVVRRFIEDDCGLPMHEISSTDIASGGYSERLAQQVGWGSFAVCLLSRDEMMVGGRARADQNVVYQARFFQGKYGFSRVALLIEEGRDGPSNVAGIVRLDFPSPQVDATFIDLRRMLQREGLLPTRKRSDV